MKLISASMALTIVTVIVTVTALTLALDQGDGVCTLCPCDDNQCSGDYATCCYRFYTFSLIRLRVSVNCSHPDQSHITLPSQNFQTKFNCSGFHLTHEYSCLTAFPDNYCKYGAIRAVSLDNNNLSTFPVLKCLFNLGKLNLNHNMLTSVPQEAFKGLQYIQEIFLDYNEISYIHPLVFEEGMAELSIFSVSHNRLVTIEPWPLMLHHKFCFFGFSHNHIRHFSNKAHLKINMSKDAVYGPGYVDFSYNQFEGGLAWELEQFGINNIQQLSIFIKWGFDFRHNPLRCDCKIYEAVKWLKVLAIVMWRDYFNVTCGSPPSLRDRPILKLPMEALICNVTADCPSGCYCEDQPAKHATFIFCDNGDLTSLPHVLPEGNHLIIHMANNSITKLGSRQYLNRTKMIDLSGNKMNEIEKEAFHLLKNAKLVDLRHNEVHHLPSTLQVLDPDVVHLDLHTLTCSCDQIWLSAWLQNRHSQALEGMTCLKEDGQRILLINSTKQDFCDAKPASYQTSYKMMLILLTLVLSVLTTVISVLAVFRYEAQVVAHSCRERLTQCRKKQSTTLEVTHRFKVFISMSANSNEDTEWVKNVLIPTLDGRDLASYLPQRDCTPGSVEMDELIKRMKDSATALVILSPAYMENSSCLFQFSQIYSYMIAGKQGRLLLIRREGSLSRRSIREPHLRAMLTFGMFCLADQEHLNKALDTLVT